MREVFTREIAVEEDLRKDARLDKGFMKRPAVNIFTKKIVNSSYGSNGVTTKYEKNIKKIYGMCKQYKLKSHEDAYRDSFEGDKAKQSYIASLGSKAVSLSLLASNENFKKKTFVAYVEKQHGNTYTLRDIRFSPVEICEIELGEYYDIAGRAVFLDMSRKDGVVEVHRVTEMFAEKL